MSRIAVLIPARDEASAIGATVEAVKPLSHVQRVLVIDDGSRDATAELAAAAGAEVLVVHESGGKAAALEAGLREIGVTRAGARGSGGPDARWDAVVFLDGDLGACAEQAMSLMGPVLDGSADMTIAAFPPPPEGSGGFGLVKGLARTGIRRLGDETFETTAPLSGQRALGPKALAVALPLGRGYGVEVTLTVRALRHGLTVIEVPTTMTHRHTGRDAAGLAHRGRQFVNVAAALAALAAEPRRGGGAQG